MGIDHFCALQAYKFCMLMISCAVAVIACSTCCLQAMYLHVLLVNTLASKPLHLVCVVCVDVRAEVRDQACEPLYVASDGMLPQVLSC